MRVQIALLISLATPLAGCNSVDRTAALAVTDTRTQVVRTNTSTNSKFIVSKLSSSVVAVSLPSEDSWNEYGQAIAVKIRNTSSKAVPFGVSNIEVQSQGGAVAVLDHAGMEKAIEDKQNGKQALAVFGAVAGGLGAGLYAGSSRANPVVSAALTQTVVASVQASSVSVANGRAEADVLSNESVQTFVTNKVIPPRGDFGGLVVAPDAGGDMQVTVSVGQDRHVFSLQ